ncbi:MAG: hypothetical protein ACE5J5_01975 [Candidatus Hydrothermarchaeales archaeon]
METVNRFCRDCYQTTSHEVKLDGRSYECIVCKKSRKSIWMKESKKEDALVSREIISEGISALKILEK